MANRLFSFVIWAAVGASMVAWVLPLLQPPEPAPPDTQVAQAGPAPRVEWDRLLVVSPLQPDGAQLAAADAARFRLVGVAGSAVPGSGAGVAVIALDDKPPRAYRAGAVIDGQRVVQEVSAHTVKIGLPKGPALITLQAPLLPPPATGILPPAPPLSGS